MILTAKIVGSASETSWSQVHLFSPTLPEKEKKYGTFLAVINLRQEETNVDLAAFGTEIISRLQETYYGQEMSSSCLEHLKNSVRQIKDEFSPQNQNLNLTLIIAVVQDNTLYLSLLGQGKVLLQRQNQLGTILSSTGYELSTASGYLQDEDVFLLGTQNFFQTISSSIIFQTVKNNSPKKSAEILTPLVHQQPETSQMAAILVKIKFLPPERNQPLNDLSLPSTSLIPSPIPKPITHSPQPTPPPRSRSSFHFPRLPQVSLQFFNRTRQIKSAAGRLFTLLKKPFEKVQPLYLKAEKEKQKKITLTIGVLLIVLLLLSIGFGAVKRLQSQKQEKFQKVFAEVDFNFQQGQSLININPNLAKTHLEKAAQILNENLTNFEKDSSSKEKLAQKENEIKNALQAVKKEYLQSQLTLFLNLDLIKKDLKASDLYFSQAKLFFVAQDGTVFSVDSQTKASKILGKTASPALITVYNDKIYLVQDGIQQLTDGQLKNVVKKEDLTADYLDFDNFGGSLYLLEKSKKEIYVLPVIESGFGQPRRWLKPGIELTQTPLSFSINGSVWVGTVNAQVLKFTRGQPENFSFQGLDEKIEKLLDLYTCPDCQFLYLLEKNRLVVVNKDGQYAYQYRWLNETPARVVADEAAKKIFLVKDEKVWILDLK